MSNNTRIKAKSRNFITSLFPLVCCLVIGLTGCVRYDVGLNFNSPYSGNIVQHIKVAQQLASLDNSGIRKWFDNIESQARHFKGKIKKINSEELLVTIPFSNGQELSTKFNQLFHSDIPVTSAIDIDENADLIKLDSFIDLQQSNLILVERNSLDLVIDLRALKILNSQSKIKLDSDRAFDLQFQLNTPLIAYSLSGSDNLQPINSTAKHLTWRLQPGEINHIQAVFLLPSPIGIGTIIIILLGIIGFYLKYRRFPGVPY